VLGALSYFLGIALLVSPVALVAAPLALYLGLRPSSRRDLVAAAALALLAVLLCLGPADDYEQLERAWLLLLAGALAVTLLAGGSRRFPASAFVALGGAGAAAGALMAATSLTWTKVARIAEHHFFPAFRSWINLVAPVGNPGRETVNDTMMSVLHGLSQFVPGLVLLQTFAALALAWALYHRLARRPEGEPLGTLASFRFNDHAIWGVAIALLVLVLPRLPWSRALGGNLLVFFGGLYLVRGVAVLVALAAAVGLGSVIILLLTVFLWPVVGAAALALGLTDTLVDWRLRLARAAGKP